MRVTFESMHRNAMSGIEAAAERLTAFQRQVSSGKRLEKPSDDPSATLGAIGERNESATIDQYKRATDTVGSRLSVVDTVLSDLINQVTAAQVAAAGARGTTKTQAQRDAIATDLEGMRDTVFADLNASFGGTYLFAGIASTAAAYTRTPGGPISAYAGSTQEMEVDVDATRSVKIAFNGQQLTQGADAADIFTEFDNLIAAVRAGSQAGIDTGRAALDRMFERVSTAQGRVGADMRTVDEQKIRLGEMRRASGMRLSGFEDANMAEAISGMTQADAAYRAALAAASTITKQSLMDFLR